jgi:hypothetical protein
MQLDVCPGLPALASAVTGLVIARCTGRGHRLLGIPEARAPAAWCVASALIDLSGPPASRFGNCHIQAEVRRPTEVRNTGLWPLGRSRLPVCGADTDPVKHRAVRAAIVRAGASPTITSDPPQR